MLSLRSLGRMGFMATLWMCVLPVESMALAADSDRALDTNRISEIGRRVDAPSIFVGLNECDPAEIRLGDAIDNSRTAVSGLRGAEDLRAIELELPAKAEDFPRSDSPESFDVQEPSLHRPWVSHHGSFASLQTRALTVLDMDGR
jgi:hypothetical protein